MEDETDEIPFPDTDPVEVAILNAWRARREAVAAWRAKRYRAQARHLREEDKRGRKQRYGAAPGWRAIQSLAVRALAQGATWLRPGHLVWNLAPHCERAYERTVGAGPYSRGELRQGDEDRTLASAFMSLTYQTPCRRCASCLEHRRELWSARARHETRHSPETLFGTLTLSQVWHNECLGRCRADAAADGVDFDALASETQFARRVSYAGREVTKYIKLIRLLSPAPVLGDKPMPNLRYILVAEPHASGLPHFHMLLHSIHSDFRQNSVKMFVRSTGREVDTWPMLEVKWKHGFSAWRRVTETNATYVCKYLSKDSRVRVRASENYGSFEYERVNDLYHSMEAGLAGRSVVTAKPSVPSVGVRNSIREKEALPREENTDILPMVTVLKLPEGLG